MQKDLEGNVNIVTTASRVMSSAEKRYTNCEQELLTIMYALEKFRVHVHRNKIFFLTTDNGSNFPSEMCYHIRVARPLKIIQKYDIELQHTRGFENHLADILNRNPAGLEVNEHQDLTKPNTISVNKTELKTDQAVLKNWAEK
jgi:hypothetical protein